MAIAVGSKAPDFTLKTKTAEGLKDVSLSASLAHKQVVLLFFPWAFSSVCTKEFCDLSSGLGQYSQLNAEVIGISVDTPHAQEAWAKQNAISVKLASDLNKQVINAYQVVLPMLGGVGDAAARAAFVIGRDGIVKYSEQTPTPKDLPNFDAIKAALAS